MRPGVLATQHVKRNLLNLYREGKTYRWFVFSCCLRERKMSGMCSLFPPFGDPWPSCLLPSHRTVARQAPLSMGFSRQEHWSGLPCPPPGGLPDPGMEPTSLVSPALAGRLFDHCTAWGAPGLSPEDILTRSPGQ